MIFWSIEPPPWDSYPPFKHNAWYSISPNPAHLLGRESSVCARPVLKHPHCCVPASWGPPRLMCGEWAALSQPPLPPSPTPTIQHSAAWWMHSPPTIYTAALWPVNMRGRSPSLTQCSLGGWVGDTSLRKLVTLVITQIKLSCEQHKHRNTDSSKHITQSGGLIHAAKGYSSSHVHSLPMIVWPYWLLLIRYLGSGVSQSNERFT